MNICFITYRYPGKHNTSDFVFVKQLVDAIASMGHDCYVLSPYNINHYRCYSPIKEHYLMGLGSVMVLRPWYLSFSSKIGFLHRISGKLYRKAIQKAFRRLPCVPDVIYGHFWHSAFGGYEYAKEYRIPLLVASGESEITFRRNSDIKSAFCEYVRGVVCVSSKNKDESVGLGLSIPEKCQVFPNAVNIDRFKRIDKHQCREQLGLPQDAFIIAFVGWFIERKGPLRVSEALKRINGEKVYSLFIGKGEQIPDCDNILFKGPLPHEKVPVYLNAADVFVLPTLHEGCCNAVVEAMACGLPIISSNLPFNWDVLNESNSILINPNNIDEMSKAIIELRDDKEKRDRLSQGALSVAQNLTIEKRAKAIMEFIESKIN